MQVFALLVSVPFCVAVLLRLATRLSLLDAPEAAPERKRQAHSIPAVGGSALLLAGALSWLLWGPGVFGLDVVSDLGPLWVGLALFLAYGVGLVDDLRKGGLSPLQKVLGQVVAAIPLAIAAWEPYGALAACAAIPSALVAMNLANTYDNADGALTSLAAVSLLPVAPAASFGLFAFLPFNMGRWSLHKSDAAPEPRSYLGDSGSHLIGVFALCYPPVWGFFLLPALDLARVSILRVRAGRRIWSGDRWHLAHRFEERGLSAAVVLAVLLAIAMPVVVGPLLVPELGLPVGALCTTLLFLLAVRGSRTPAS
jgi:hypothetical protein